MMERCQKFFSLFTVLHLLCAKRFFAFVSDSLVSNSKQALTPKTETLIFLVIAANNWWRRLCDLHWNNEKPFQFSMPETPLYSFRLPCFCRRSSIQFAFHNAVVKIFLVLSALGPPLLFCFELFSSSSLHFLSSVPCFSLFSVSLNLTLRKRATSPWILHVSKNSRAANLIQKWF